MHYTYLVRCSDNSLYCGYTTDPKQRTAAHNAGKGAKYTRSKRPVQLVYVESFETKEDAMKREAQIKKFSRKQKLELLKGMSENYED